MQDNPYLTVLTKIRHLIEDGNYEAARSPCAELCKAYPQQAVGWQLLGWICSETGAYSEALSSLQVAARLNPECADTLLNMGVIYQRQNNLPASLTYYTKALGLQPDSVAAQYNIGLIQERQGEFDAAMKSYRKVQAMNPAMPEPVLAQAAVYEKIGNPDKAEYILRPLIEKGIKSVKAGVTLSRICTSTSQYQQTIKYLLSIPDNNLTRDDRIDLHFTLGRLYDRTGNFEVAFRHFQTGNSAHGSSYDSATDSRYFNALVTGHSKAAFKTAPTAANQSRRPIFIVGMPRSGTSLVEQILASHPDVAGGGELPDIMRIAGILNTTFDIPVSSPAAMNKLTPPLVDQFTSDYLSALVRISDATLHVTDKMPHNFLHLGLIKTLFPAAIIIHCRRHPMDTCLSCYFQRFAGTTMPCSYDLNHMAQHYNHYQQVMDYWKNTAGIAVFEIRYEVLVTSQQSVTRQLLEYCGLPWNDACLRFHKTKHVTRTASYGQVRKALYSSSAERWKNYEKFLHPLKNTLRAPAY